MRQIFLVISKGKTLDLVNLLDLSRNIFVFVVIVLTLLPFFAQY